MVLSFHFGITTFYEYFIEPKGIGRVSKRFRLALIMYPILLSLFIAVLFVSPAIIKVKYSYIAFCTIFVSPLVYLLVKKPHFLGKFAPVAVFFFLLFLVCEYTALKTSQWAFQGNYIGMVNILGIEFPFEELFFWIMISSSGFLAYYEIFVDDEQ